MKTVLLAVVLAAASASAAPVGSQLSTSLQPARLQPASGLDAARGIGERGAVRILPDSTESWKVRFPKQPNGLPR